MMDKTILIALALIGVILFFGLVSPPQQSQETATAQQGQLIDSGEFVVDQGGERVIDEQYTLFFSPAEGYMLLSQETMAVSGQKITLAQQYEFDRDFMPVLYHLAADTPSGSQIISAQMGIKGLHMETRVGTAQQQADVPGKDVMILDNNLISHYVVLLLALQAGDISSQFTASILKHLVAQRGHISSALLLTQREVAMKVANSPGKEGTSLGVLVQSYADVKLLRSVPRGSFFPVPDVDSSLWSISFLDE